MSFAASGNALMAIIPQAVTHPPARANISPMKNNSAPPPENEITINAAPMTANGMPKNTKHPASLAAFCFTPMRATPRGPAPPAG
ncbi:MAG TPA: hypothetical protein PKN23_15330, partial [Candidatus Hydrogenedentes bacterium]|nr:hypothetical protein [Candidatus Hydrogenedentota bacterium]